MDKTMTKRERVLATINMQQPDRVPQGELGMEGGFVDALLNGQQLPYLGRLLETTKKLEMDLVNLHEFPKKLVGYDEKGWAIYQSGFGDVFKETPHSFQLLKPAVSDMSEVDDYKIDSDDMITTHYVEYFKKNSDLFIFAQVNGPVSALDWTLGTEDFLVHAMLDTDKIVVLANKMMDFEIKRAKRFIDTGADGIFMADDIAYNDGLFLPPNVMEKVGYDIHKRCIKEIKAYKDVPVFLHTDGKMDSEIQAIIECGFDGLQSLQPSAGMDIYEIKKKYGDKLCLMGNLDLDYLMTFGKPEQVKEEVDKLKKHIGKGGGYILSTCNILTDAVKLDNAKAMYLNI